MELLHKYGYSMVFSVIFLEQLGLPIPAAPILILAGAFSASGVLSLPVALICAAAGCFLGDLIWYEIGRRKGRGVLKILCRLSLSPDSCVRKTETSFLRDGMNSLHRMNLQAPGWRNCYLIAAFARSDLLPADLTHGARQVYRSNKYEKLKIKDKLDFL